MTTVRCVRCCAHSLLTLYEQERDSRCREKERENGRQRDSRRFEKHLSMVEEEKRRRTSEKKRNEKRERENSDDDGDKASKKRERKEKEE